MKLSKLGSITKPFKRFGSKLLSWLRIVKKVQQSDVTKSHSSGTQFGTSSPPNEKFPWQCDSSYYNEIMGLPINPQKLHMYTTSTSSSDSSPILLIGESFIRVETDGEVWSEADEYSLPGSENEMIECGYRALQDSSEKRHGILSRMKLELETEKCEEVGLPRNPPIVNGRWLRR